MSDTTDILRFAARAGIEKIKLNLGSGGRPLPGWINIDNFDYEKNDSSRSGAIYDIKSDIRDLNVPDASVDAILLVHVLEHFVRWEAVKMLAMFFRKLKPGGSLIVEMPDFDKCVEWYLRGRDAPHIKTPLGVKNMGQTQFYGNQWDELDYETHRYVWTLSEFLSVLGEMGYMPTQVGHDAKFHQPGRDMFIVACRPEVGV
jgi:predicted SAM-dependent methyltransferase